MKTVLVEWDDDAEDYEEVFPDDMDEQAFWDEAREEIFGKDDEGVGDGVDTTPI